MPTPPEVPPTQRPTLPNNVPTPPEVPPTEGGQGNGRAILTGAAAVIAAGLGLGMAAAEITAMMEALFPDGYTPAPDPVVPDPVVPDLVVPDPVVPDPVAADNPKPNADNNDNDNNNNDVRIAYLALPGPYL